jgi:hypothetical protein
LFFPSGEHLKTFTRSRIVTASQTTSARPEEQFALDRFGRLLQRRLQVAVACTQMPAAATRQSWLIRALDGAIADELRQLDRLGHEADAREMLVSFRQTLDWLKTSKGQAA